MSAAYDHIPGRLRAAVESARMRPKSWRVRQVVGTIVRATAPALQVGELCRLRDPRSGAEVDAEVIGFADGETLLTPIGSLRGVSPMTEVISTGRTHSTPVGDGLLGRVLDGMGRPLDREEMGPLTRVEDAPVEAEAPDPLSRRLVSEPLAMGVRAIDGPLTCGRGQRIGVFAASGGGKSTLLSMMVKNAAADVVVVALIGERGREVREFLDEQLDAQARRKSVVVVATSDRASMERVKAAYVATAIAERFRDDGKDVLLLMDSVTRFARALREIGLAAGEPPARRGFPPSVFSTLPKLLERSGPASKGSITAVYTVLVEGDDMSEPVADEVRSIVDGHIVLSRKLAAAGRYPAIDVAESASRVMRQVVSREHLEAATKLRALIARRREVELLVRLGEYAKGSDPETDEAIAKATEIDAFLRQAPDETEDFDVTRARLEALAG